MHEISLLPAKGNKLAPLTASLQGMFALIDRYINDCKDVGVVDVPYHYNERATLSVLAGAIWRASLDNYVLEEFRTEKKWTEGCYKGRQDIWFRVSGQSYYGEAKQEWVPLYRIREEMGVLLSVLHQETNAAQQNLPSTSSTNQPPIGMGVLFVVPYILDTRIEHARGNLATHHELLAGALKPWCDSLGYQVLWGKYVREDLLEKSGCYQWSNGQSGSCPSLDTLICTKS